MFGRHHCLGFGGHIVHSQMRLCEDSMSRGVALMMMIVITTTSYDCQDACHGDGADNAASADADDTTDAEADADGDADAQDISYTIADASADDEADAADDDDIADQRMGPCPARLAGWLAGARHDSRCYTPTSYRPQYGRLPHARAQLMCIYRQYPLSGEDITTWDMQATAVLY